MLGNCLENVRKTVPLVHNITNYVTVNDVANVLLACGGSPIMSDEIDDVSDITSICGGLNINIGTLNKNTIAAMFAAGKKGQRAGTQGCVRPGWRRRICPSHKNRSGFGGYNKVRRNSGQHFRN